MKVGLVQLAQPFKTKINPKIIIFISINFN
jgi:hypothetical protein